MKEARTVTLVQVWNVSVLHCHVYTAAAIYWRGVKRLRQDSNILGFTASILPSVDLAAVKHKAGNGSHLLATAPARLWFARKPRSSCRGERKGWQPLRQNTKHDSLIAQRYNIFTPVSLSRAPPIIYEREWSTGTSLSLFLWSRGALNKWKVYSCPAVEEKKEEDDEKQEGKDTRPLHSSTKEGKDRRKSSFHSRPVSFDERLTHGLECFPLPLFLLSYTFHYLCLGGVNRWPITWVLSGQRESHLLSSPAP